MEVDKKYAVYVKASVDANIKEICIANDVDKAEAYFDKEDAE